MPARRPTQSERIEETRARILEATVKVLIARGYAGLRVLEVARTAGVSPGGQLHHFPTKNSLVLAALDHVFDQLDADPGEDTKPLAREDDTIALLLADARRFFFSDYFLIGLDLMMAGGKQAALHDAAASISARRRNRIEEEWTARLANHGLSETTAQAIVWCTMSGVRGLAVRRLLGVDRIAEEAVLALLEAMLRQQFAIFGEAS